jgi:hypothetical protein
MPYIGSEASGVVASELATHCLRDVGQAGIPSAEIEAAVGNLETYLIGKINIVAGKEIGRMAAEDNN